MRRRALPLAVFVALTLTFVAVAPVAAQDGANNTTGNTTTPEPEQPDTLGASLDVQQPSWVSSGVSTTTADGKTVYQVQGDQQTLSPQNFDGSSASGFGVIEPGASMSRTGDSFIFSGDEAGTYNLYWSVNGTRYEAAIQLESSNYVHVPQGEYDSVQQNAQRWTDFTGQIRDIFGDDADVERQVQSAIEFFEIKANPLNALTGSLTSIVLLIVTTGGGLLFVTIGAIYVYVVRRKDVQYRRRIEQLESEEEDVDEKLDLIAEKERKQALENVDWRDIFPNDEVAFAFRDNLGDSVYTGWLRLQELIMPNAVVVDRLRAMGADGFVGVRNEGDERYEVRDLGETEALRDGEDDDYDLSDSEYDEAINLRTVDEDDLSEIAWDSNTVREYDLSRSTVSEADDAISWSSPSLSELMEDLDMQIPRDVESKEAFAEYLGDFVEYVAEHDYADEDGSVRREREALNRVLRLQNVVGDKYEVPLVAFYRETITKQASEYDMVEDAKERVREIQAGGKDD